MGSVTRRAALAGVGAGGAALAAGAAAAAPAPSAFRHSYVTRNGVKLHTASLGKGPPVVFVHGFPDFWWSWRDQMAVVSRTHTAVALDQRGYNLSDKPEGDAAYAMPELVQDVAAVIDSVGGRAALVGHDWGGAVSWQVAGRYPDKVERLAILNLPHPANMARELQTNPAQQANSAYARNFQQPGAASKLTAEGLAGWVKAEDRAPYVEAFKRSNFESMLAYYRVNYPKPPYNTGAAGPMAPLKMRTLVIHGLDDKALLSSGLDRTWDRIDAPLTMVTIPHAGHFVQRDAADEVSRALVNWLAAPPLRT